MEWSQAALRIDHPSCDAVAQLEPGQRLRCINPGSQGSVLAHMEGGVAPPGWVGVQCTGYDGYHIKESGCSACPLQALPADVLPLQVEATSDGLDVRVACARPAALAEAYHHLRRQGQVPHVRRSGRLRAGAPTTAVDLSVLTPRQQEALQTAVRMGYFEDPEVGVDALGKALGCSRSTAHEHLRRGMARLLADIFT